MSDRVALQNFMVVSLPRWAPPSLAVLQPR
jgi:hypothetical protein